MAYPKHLLWLDLETPGLSKDTEILEIGCIVTDMQLHPIKGYESAIKLTPLAIEQLKVDDVARNMHLESGLLKDCKYSATTVREAEIAIIDMLIASGASPQEVILAGSGIARFDFDILALHMPDLTEWLVYFVVDVGISRRIAHLATEGRSPFPKVAESFQEGVKAHRALADARAHLEEGRGQWNVFRALAGLDPV